MRDDDAIALDGSTTCYFLAQELRDRRGLVVLTNGLRTAEMLSEAGAIVVLPGGTLRRSSWSLIGDIGDVFVGRGRVARGFFGVRSLSPEAGLRELSVEETAVKRRLVSVSGEVYGLFDSSNASRHGPLARSGQRRGTPHAVVQDRAPAVPRPNDVVSLGRSPR